ncbi:unnamed protein product [Candida verbasci]|uniref:Cell wall mannoprotein PIR1-like C-terminal domain-containing protein n=1 Tax=Candida verbasci TaxID=1227364 RepID=A0A9W4TUP7_9ASCO|nr:unnamed protein product [Candida verbasci]
MKYSTFVTLASILSTTVIGAALPASNFSTLTPTATAPSGATTDYTKSFGFQIETVEVASKLSTDNATSTLSLKSASTTNGKRDVVNVLSDGQPNDITSSNYANPTPTTVKPVAQISDGQIQNQKSAAAQSVVNQISDGQVQNNPTTAASVVNQIGDGQVQNNPTTAASVVNQIGDGQVQNNPTTAAQTTAAAVNQISDGQVQNNSKTTAAAVSQISDGQVQGSKTASTNPTASGDIGSKGDGQVVKPPTNSTASEGDGQVIKPPTNSTASTTLDSNDSVPTACVSKNNLVMNLKDGVLRDSQGRIGSIVANYQLQFDAGTQAGAIYGAGWSIYDGYLYLGDDNVFYQCLSGDFYNLYNENIGAQCNAIKLRIIDFVEC